MIKVNKIVKTCDFCPAQWEGITDDNRQIYVRYRLGTFSIKLGNPNDMEPFAAVNGTEVLRTDYGEELGGTMTYSELKELAKVYVQFPEYESKNLE